MSASNEVNAAVGEASDLEARAVALRRIMGAKSEKEQAAEELAAVERQIAARAVAALTGQAKARLLGIQRADGSLADQKEQDDDRVLKTAKAYVEAVLTSNARARKRKLLQHEARLLADAFALPMPALRDVEIPARGEVGAEAVGIVSAVELAATLYVNPEPDHGELGDLDGRELLRQKAELEPPPSVPGREAPTLSQEQSEMLAGEAARLQRPKLA